MKEDDAVVPSEGTETTSAPMAEILLRLLPMTLSIVAMILMLKDSEKTTDYGSLSYSDVGAFRYLVHATGVCAGYSLLSAIVAAVPRPSTLPRAWTFFLLDQLITYLVLAAGAISAEMVYLAYKGDASITWSEACDSFGDFCRKAKAATAITFVVTLCYAGLSVVSSYRLFTRYEAPAPVLVLDPVPIGSRDKDVDLSS